MLARPKPIALAMVICDTVIEDKKTGKKSLIGLFNSVSSDKVPCIHPRLNVFISLTEGNGDYTGKLKCIYADEGKPLAEISGPVVFTSPHQIIELNFEIRGVPLPKYGNYRFEFFCNDEMLIARKFQLSPSPLSLNI